MPGLAFLTLGLLGSRPALTPLSVTASAHTHTHTHTPFHPWHTLTPQKDYIYNTLGHYQMPVFILGAHLSLLLGTDWIFHWLSFEVLPAERGWEPLGTGRMSERYQLSAPRVALNAEHLLKDSRPHLAQAAPVVPFQIRAGGERASGVDRPGVKWERILLNWHRPSEIDLFPGPRGEGEGIETSKSLKENCNSHPMSELIWIHFQLEVAAEGFPFSKLDSSLPLCTGRLQQFLFFVFSCSTKYP